MRKLILTVGLPRSGKSTWAKEQGYPIVCPDAIRYALHGNQFLSDAEDMVWSIAKYMAKALFIAGNDTVIIDATNNTQKRRDIWEALAKKMDAEVELKVFDTPKEVCIERAKATGMANLIPIIEKMADESDIVTKER